MNGFFKPTDKPKTEKKAKDITLDAIVAELESARLVAMAKGNASAMVSATMAKAKLCGLDKGEIITPQETKFNISFISPTGEVTAIAKAEFREVAKEVLA